MESMCCMSGCKVTPAQDVYYFKLPTKPALRRRWLAVIRSPSKLDMDASVCSAHFHPADYQTVRGKTRLLKNKVPLDPDELKTQPSDSNHSQETSKQTNTTDTQENGMADRNTRIKNGVEKETVKKKDRKEKEKKKSGVRRSEGESELNGEVEKDCDDSNAIEIQITPDIIEDYGGTLHVTPDIIEDYDTTIKPPDLLDPDINDDIEDILTNYHIMNPPRRRDREQHAEKHRETPEKHRETPEKHRETPEKHRETPEKLVEKPTEKPPEKLVEKAELPTEKQPEKREKSAEKPSDDVQTIEDDDDDLPYGVSNKPVFIEIPVGKDRSAESHGDCLMVLESLQVSIDPSSLMLSDPGELEHIEIDDKSDDQDEDRDPISLLTSSDEDEVILQEPHIDTVEVSDETDEDDVPLVRLVKPKDSIPDVAKIFWGAHDYFCNHCTFCTFSPSLYKSHLRTHSTTAIQICQFCGFTTASEYQFLRHKKKHREERRFKCHLCDYRARHNMSLIYHLKTHENKKVGREFYKCDRCSFKSNLKSKAMKHIRGCRQPKVYKCDKCRYTTKRNSDLKRHHARKHQDSDGGDWA